MIPDPITIDPSEPVRFAEAVDYFRKQAPWISGSSWATMARLSALKGDQVSGASMLAVLDDVWRRMDRAVEQGLPYSEFVRSIGSSMGWDWASGVDSARLRLIYHNNVGSALMAGRMAQVMDPDVVVGRPYLLFDAIEDFRTSQICLARNGICRPATDPWWQENAPLLHHGCRSSVISLDEEDLKEEGGLTARARLRKLEPAQEGWGKTHSWEDWQPRGEDYHPALWQEYTRWRDGGVYARDLETWRGNLSASWGKALGLDPSDLERVIDVPRERRDDVPEVSSHVRPTGKLVEEGVRDLLDQWVLGSKRRASVILKRAAIEELGLSGVAYSRVVWEITDEDVRKARPAVRRIYEDTQEYLREQYPSRTVRLYRGVKSKYAVTGTLESWTADPEVARKFDGHAVIEENVPIEKVFSCSGGPNWKNGKYGEQYEFVVLSDAPKMKGGTE